MSMDNNTPNQHGPNAAPDTHPSSMAIPNDKEIPYQVNAHGKPAHPGPGAGLPGHKKVDPAILSNEAANRYAQAQAEIQTKRAAQLAADTGTGGAAKFTPAPAPKAARPAARHGKRG